MTTARCFRLSLPCLPQRLGRLAPSSSSSSSSSAAAAAAAAAWEAGGSGSGGEEGSDEYGGLDYDDELEASRAAVTAMQLAGRPLLELVLERVDPLPMVELCLQAFHAAHREGRIDRAKTAMVLRLWRAHSLLMGTSDCSWGVGPGMAKVLGLSPQELEPGPGARSSEALRTDAPPAVRAARLRQAAARAAAASEALKATELFRRHDAGEGAPIGVHLQVFDPATGAVLRATNAARDRLFRSQKEIAEDVLRHRTVHILLAPGLFAPEDRGIFFQTTIDFAFSKPRPPASNIVKVRVGMRL